MAWWYDLSKRWGGVEELVFAEASDEDEAEEALQAELPDFLSGRGPRGPFATREAAESAAREEQLS